MKMEDLVILSVDDHICEPPHFLDNQLTGEARATAPQLKTTADGTDYWEYQGLKLPSVGLNAVVGRVPEEYGIEPTAISQLRKGCFDPKARLSDMDVNGVACSLNFSTAVGMDGGVFHRVNDKALALTHLQAYNNWHMDEWCGADSSRFIPCGLLPTWDMDATVAEIKRIAKKGYTAVSLNENPTKQGLPSIHNAYWEPLWKAIVENDIVMCLHIGSGNPAPHASMETPIEAWITTMPMSISVGAADWLHLTALQRYPTMKVALSEGGLGWVPYFLERADFAHERHKAWTHSVFKNTKPSELFHKHFMLCFIDDAFGLKNLESLNEDLVAYECDYPHSDCLWPNVPETLWQSVKNLTDTQIDKVTHRNAMKFFRFDPFKSYRREDLSVAALRARAKAAKVDITPQSYGGSRPLEEGEADRVVTSGDIVKMFAARDKQKAA